MRQTAIRLNRSWLTVLGVLLVLVGLAGLLLGTGLAGPLLVRTGLGRTPPGPDRHLFGAATQAAFGLTWVVLVTAVVAVVLGLLGLLWLIAQVPRANAAKPFRLHDDTRTGLTRVAPDVLARAVEDQTRALPGVSAASAVIRGTTQRPELVLKVTADDRADLPELLTRLQDEVATDLGESLDTRLDRFGVQLDVGATKVSSDRVVL